MIYLSEIWIQFISLSTKKKLELNWVFLTCLQIRDPKVDKEGVFFIFFFFYMWIVYFATNFDWIISLFITTFFLCSMPTNFEWLYFARYKGLERGQHQQIFIFKLCLIWISFFFFWFYIKFCPAFFKQILHSNFWWTIIIFS